MSNAGHSISSIIWFIAGAVVATSSSGCAFLSWFRKAPPPQDALSAELRDADILQPVGGDASGENLIVVHLAFDVTHVLVPSEELAARSDDLWRNVDELRASAVMSTYLARNGFRMGVAAASNRDAILAILEELGGRSERTNMAVQSGQPLMLDLGALAGKQVVVAFRPSGKLVSKTIEDAIRRIQFDYDAALGDPPVITLRMTPELYKESARPQWKMRDGEIRYEKHYEGVVYRDLAVQIELAPGEVVILGSADASGTDLTLGRKMFGEVVSGRRWETVLCIQPQLFRREKGR